MILFSCQRKNLFNYLAMHILNPKVDHYLSAGCGRCSLANTPQCKVHRWPEELELLRSIALECGLKEDLKWSMPCYTYENNNIVMVAAFNEHAVLSFFKGALLKDAHGILSKPGDNTQAARQARFTDTASVKTLEPVLKAYILEAIEVEKAGTKVQFKKADEYDIPEELQQKFGENPALKTAFYALTPGRQRAYLLHFAAPKQSQTRSARIEKYMQHILDGKGLYD